MSKETENVFKEFDKFMADKNVNSSDDFKKMVSQFMSQYNEIDFHLFFFLPLLFHILIITYRSAILLPLR